MIDVEPNSDTQSLTDLTGRLREQIVEAQTMLETGDIKGAEALGKATLQLIKALEAQVKFEASQKAETKQGVTYDADDIARARVELTRRLDRLAARFVDQGLGGGT